MPEYFDARSIPSISPGEARQRVQEEEAALIDVRESEEYLAGHAEGAVNIPLSSFRERYQDIPQQGDVLLICHVGQRSLMAAAFMRNQGWRHVFNVEGGTDEWEAMRLPMTYPG
jgi:rhodanese-related sulfurtransferase